MKLIPGNWYLVVGRENHGPVQYVDELYWAHLVKNREGREVTYADDFELVPMTALLWELV